MMRHTISLPEAMSLYVDEQIAGGMYGNVSEYFRDLVRKDQERKAYAIGELREMIDKARASGIGTRSMEQIMENAKSNAIAQGLLDE